MASEKKPKIIIDRSKDKIIRDIWIPFEQEDDYHEPKRLSNFWNNNYIEYESNGDKNKNLSLDEYLNKIKPYMSNITIGLQNSDAWKIQLTIAANFISLKDGEEERVMHSSSGNIKFTPYGDADDVIDELFESLRSKYQLNLEISMRRSDFISNSVQLMYCKCYRVHFMRGGSYIDSPDWIKRKKTTTINPKNTGEISVFNTQQLLH